MAKKRSEPKITNEEIRKLVIERLKTLSPNKDISIGSDGFYTKDQLIDEIERGSKVGEKIIKVELEFLQSLKDLPIYATEISSNN